MNGEISKEVTILLDKMQKLKQKLATIVNIFRQKKTDNMSLNLKLLGVRAANPDSLLENSLPTSQVFFHLQSAKKKAQHLDELAIKNLQMLFRKRTSRHKKGSVINLNSNYMSKDLSRVINHKKVDMPSIQLHELMLELHRISLFSLKYI